MFYKNKTQIITIAIMIAFIVTSLGVSFGTSFGNTVIGATISQAKAQEAKIILVQEDRFEDEDDDDEDEDEDRDKYKYKYEHKSDKRYSKKLLRKIKKIISRNIDDITEVQDKQIDKIIDNWFEQNSDFRKETNKKFSQFFQDLAEVVKEEKVEKNQFDNLKQSIVEGFDDTITKFSDLTFEILQIINEEQKADIAEEIDEYKNHDGEEYSWIKRKVKKIVTRIATRKIVKIIDRTVDDFTEKQEEQIKNIINIWVDENQNTIENINTKFIQLQEMLSKTLKQQNIERQQIDNIKQFIVKEVDDIMSNFNNLTFEIIQILDHEQRKQVSMKFEKISRKIDRRIQMR